MIASTTPQREIQELLSSGQAHGVGLSSHRGFARKAPIDFLTELEGLRALHVQDPADDGID